MTDLSSFPHVEPKIIFEDDFLLIIDKPAGIHSVGQNGAIGMCLASSLAERFPFLRSAASKPTDSGLIQRLDFMTSGLIIAAKSRPVWETMRKQLKAGHIDKTYHLLVYGQAAKDFCVESFLGSPYRRSKKVRVYPVGAPPPPRTLKACSFFTPLGHDAYRSISLLECKASPARRHQVRAHAAHAGYPLVGDTLYGSQVTLSKVIDQNSGELPDFFLHARTVRFSHPISQQLVYAAASYPKWFIEHFSKVFSLDACAKDR